MAYIVVDTCIVMHIMRKSPEGQQALDFINNQAEEPTTILSVVTKAELQSLGLLRSWGNTKRHFIEYFINSATVVDISHTDTDLISAYAAMDAYSKGQGPDPNGNSKQGSAVKIGKNDLWIAATALVLDATLLTSDGDFDHLANTFLKIEKVKTIAAG
jgi:tRNA(fMet)-specific endonuclease VapC